MAERKSLSKKIRFEVFKRDHFTCQYCGRMAPDVILEVDHMHPVAEGGDDDIINLITSCRDCNRGKGRTPLSKNDSLKKSQAQMLDLAERTEQAQMMIDWKTEMLSIREREAESINDLLISISGRHLSDSGFRTIKKLLKSFGFPLVWEAVEIAIEKYFKDYGTERERTKSMEFAFSKIGGICYNKQKGSVNDGGVSEHTDNVLDGCQDCG